MPLPPHTVRAHGVTCLLASHPRIRRLRRASPPAIHGTRQWPSSWLLIDYLSRHPLPRGARVIEVGAGWGLAGIYCARRFDAEVLCIDKDVAVLPYLELHAELNGVRLRTLTASFGGLGKRLLEGTHALIGSDICFWKALVPEVSALIRRALRSGVAEVLIADPARSTFERMAAGLVDEGLGELRDWRVRAPRPSAGRILRASASLARRA